MWNRLLACADHYAENEMPQWVANHEPEPEKVAALLAEVDAMPKEVLANDVVLSGREIQDQLKALASCVDLPLEVTYWQERIEREKRFVPECWEFLARAQLARGDAVGAEASLAKVLLCGKSQPYLFLLLGTCREAELDYEGAEHYYCQAIARNPANANFHTHLANLWLAQGEYTKAEAYLIKAINQHPDKLLLVHTLANCLDQQQRTKEALGLLKTHGADEEGATPLLANQWASFTLKAHPEQEIKRHNNVDYDNVKAQACRFLVNIENPAARYDLARRLVNTWTKLDFF